MKNGPKKVKALPDLYGDDYLDALQHVQAAMIQTPKHTHDIWTTTSTDAAWKASTTNKIDTLLDIADKDGFIRRNTTFLNGEIIFSHKKILKKHSCPKNPSISQAIDLLQWLGTLQLLAKE